MVRQVGKKAVIIIRLAEESTETANEEIEKEILEGLSTGEPKIPWFKSLDRVTVVEET